MHLENGQQVYPTTRIAHAEALSPPTTTLTASVSLCDPDLFANKALYSTDILYMDRPNGNTFTADKKKSI